MIKDKKKTLIPDHKLMLVPFESAEESYYVCALLNSSPAKLAIKSYVVENSTSTHVLDYISIPKYEPNNELHKKIASLSQEAHNRAESEKGGLKEIEQQINQSAANLWNIKEQQLVDIDESLKEWE